MEYRYSHLVEPSSDEAAALESLAGGLLPIRVHRDAKLADRAAFRAQKDWKRLLGFPLPTPEGEGCGIVGPKYNFLSVLIPETLPDRLELGAYISELSLLMDDAMDSGGVGTESGMAASVTAFVGEYLSAWEVVTRGSKEVDISSSSCPSSSPLKELFVGLIKATFAFDRKAGEDGLRWLEKWATLALSGQGFGHEFGSVRNFDDYLNYRLVNVVSHGVFGLAIFCAGLDIPQDQQKTCFELFRSFWIHASLVNDLFSWESESKAATGPSGAVTNAIWILMNKHSMTYDEAQRVCRERASQYAQECTRMLETASTRDDLCQDAKTLLEWLKLSISGHIVWSMQTPRYHAERRLTAAQMNMAEEVWADETSGWERIQETLAGAHERHHSIGSRSAPDVNGVVLDGADMNGVVFNGAGANGVVHNGAVDGCLDSNGTTPRNMAIELDVPALSIEILEAPSRYIDSLPGKGIRNSAVEALNEWYGVPESEVAAIARAVDLLHGASLMLDDIQDASPLRRGQAATHHVFGTMQTINSAGYRYVWALDEVCKLDCSRNQTDELRNLCVGQSHDLSWTNNMHCPSEEEYLAMIDGKTAGLFRMLARMLEARSTSPNKLDPALVTRLTTLLGRLFQIRDDYMNLTSADYTEKKGFCEDLDEGKYSLPLIHALGKCKNAGLQGKGGSTSTMILQNLLSQRRVTGGMTVDQKKLCLEHMERQGSIEYTRQCIYYLQAELRRLTAEMGVLANHKLNELLEMLRL
ncbi:isoprenoid synthase domain-containing protein [Corynascus novoguineensis]|uniref:Isoprenoid synthase domain-containing protein n=1 Tax=Corynascus novoguineensis TaxID=1126955 RepID=A0AAN7HPB6_9PEZI|nr:isoprenoid synthase domain-containing protein [Corynascus novoguineensis]